MCQYVVSSLKKINFKTAVPSIELLIWRVPITLMYIPSHFVLSKKPYYNVVLLHYIFTGLIMVVFSHVL